MKILSFFINCFSIMLMLCFECVSINDLYTDLLTVGEMAVLLIGNDGIFHFVAASNNLFFRLGFIPIFYYNLLRIFASKHHEDHEDHEDQCRTLTLSSCWIYAVLIVHLLSVKFVVFASCFVLIHSDVYLFF